jgi:malate dehydrogenase (oxaloacetate-decarboxylating)(NADP+)
MFNSKGALRKDDPKISDMQRAYATDKHFDDLAHAMKGADVFVGLSTGDIVTPEMLLSMADNPIVFAMANPTPEINYDIAIATRKDIIMATGRSDHPNQVNNVLGFPFIFRGALDVRATKINEEMKKAAVVALANLAKASVPEQVNIAYGETKLTFGRDYIIPKPFDPRLIAEVPPAVAKAAMESGVALAPITDWEKYKDDLLERMGSDNKMIRLLTNRARTSPKRIIFAEADQIDVLKAAQIVHEEGIGFPILLGNKKIIKELKEEIGFEIEVPIFDPKTKESEPKRLEYAKHFWESRKTQRNYIIGCRKMDA